MATLHSSRSVPNFQYLTDEESLDFKLNRAGRHGQDTDLDSVSSGNSTSRLSHLKSAPTSRSAASLLSPSTIQHHGSEQYLHTPRDMKNKPVKNAKLKSQRNLSVSTPVMPPSRSLTPDIGEKLTPHSSKSRNKKFHRIFKQVPPDERVVNFFSCALLADILLQGHLYITENYFGFYSNVFGHVTKILIPVTAVVKITKEKTAKFIPNAVGIVTQDDRHIFGSLLSRETTFRLMYKVWLRRINPDPGVRDDSEVEIPDIPDIVADDEDEDEADEDDSGSGGELGLPVAGGGQTSSESAAPSVADNDSNGELGSCPPSPENTSPSIQELVSGTALARKKKRAESPPGTANATNALRKDGQPQVIQSCFQKVYGIVPVDKMQGGARSLVLKLVSLPRCTLLLLVSTVLLLFLFLSAAMLIYRLNVLQQKMGSLDVWDTESDFKVQLFQEVFKWQRQLHDGCINHVQTSLDSRIQQLGQVRRSLRTLLLLLVPDMPQTDFNNKNSQTNS